MADEENFGDQLAPREKEIYEAGWNDAVKSIRCALRLKKMGMDDCQIVKKLEMPPSLLHELLDNVK
jgi:hypothetical protein